MELFRLRGDLPLLQFVKSGGLVDVPAIAGLLEVVQVVMLQLGTVEVVLTEAVVVVVGVVVELVL